MHLDMNGAQICLRLPNPLWNKRISMNECVQKGRKSYHQRSTLDRHQKNTRLHWFYDWNKVLCSFFWPRSESGLEALQISKTEAELRDKIIEKYWNKTAPKMRQSWDVFLSNFLFLAEVRVLSRSSNIKNAISKALLLCPTLTFTGQHKKIRIL